MRLQTSPDRINSLGHTLNLLWPLLHPSRSPPRRAVDLAEGQWTRLRDRPVIIGALYNGRGQDNAQANQVNAGAGSATANAPAWFAGSEGPHAHNAVLSGIKTQELSTSQSGAGGYNQLVFDDTPGQSRTTLATTQAGSQLNLGHLKHQSDNARKADRGHGAELITAAYGALRAGSGLLLSTDARAKATSTQLDSREAQARLTHSRAKTFRAHSSLDIV